MILATKAFRALAWPLLALWLGCRPAPVREPGPAPCLNGQDPVIHDALYFGLGIPGGGQVSEPEWQRFLAEVVTPGFPDGLTVLDATGQWRDSSGVIVRESSKLVILLHPPGPEGERHIAAIISSYRDRFKQEAVLRQSMTACISF